MLLQPNGNPKQNEMAFQQELSLNEMKTSIYGSILNGFTTYYLQNHSNPSGSLDLDQMEEIVEQAFSLYDIAFKRLIRVKNE